LQVFYSTLYTSKSTQEEDNEKQLCIGRAVIKRIERLLDENSDECNKATLEPSFSEKLSRNLSGLNAATTRNVISATMAHLIPSNGGSRFVCLHKLSDLLVGQMEATLQGKKSMYTSGRTSEQTDNLSFGQTLLQMITYCWGL
jgi:hypothetical protein